MFSISGVRPIAAAAARVAASKLDLFRPFQTVQKTGISHNLVAFRSISRVKFARAAQRRQACTRKGVQNRKRAKGGDLT